MNKIVSPLFGLALLACSGGNKDIEPSSDLLDFGDPVVSGTDLDLSDGDAVWSSTFHTLPGVLYGAPPWGIADELWEFVLQDSVSDLGTCPAVYPQGDTTEFVANCRSSDGYDLNGSGVVIREFVEDGITWEERVFDLEVVANPEDPNREFDRIVIKGSIAKASGRDIAYLVQANLQVGLEGYWNVRNEDVRDATMQDLRWSGWMQKSYVGDQASWAANMSGMAGDYGKFSLQGSPLDVSSCADELTGDLDYEGSAATMVRLDGAQACDRCVDYDVDGQSTRACP